MDNCGLRPHLLSPHLDFPDICHVVPTILRLGIRFICLTISFCRGAVPSTSKSHASSLHATVNGVRKNGVRIDDVGSILKFRIGFPFGENSAGFLPVRVAPRVRIVDRGVDCRDRLPTPFPTPRGREQKRLIQTSHYISDYPLDGKVSLKYPAGVLAKCPFLSVFSRKSLGRRPVDPCLCRWVSQGHPADVPRSFLKFMCLLLS